MTESHHPYPALFHAADRASVSSQRWYLTLSASRLWALIVVAALAAITSLIDEWSAAIALAPIIVAVFCELFLLVKRPDRIWYQARALAESVKTLAWRFQVRGRPFGFRMTDAEAGAELAGRVQSLLREFNDLGLPPALHDQVTPEMRRLRSVPLEERISAYRTGRIMEQQTWYATKADWNQKWAVRYQVGLVVFELAALSTAILSVVYGLPISFYSIFSALAVAGVGWLQIKQHHSLANSYSVASHELAAVSSTISSVKSEEAWEDFVQQAEEVISREHSLWSATNSLQRYPQ